MAKVLSHEPDASRYTLVVDGQLVAVADYRVNGHAISFNHTYTQPAMRGRGYAAEVVAFAMDDVERTSDRRVVPMCWYVAEWFDAHPERSGLLTR
ncbi:MAG TPA: GNAT family N-acetyltransferase [Rhodoglobus sp.]|nr:GNAT family N-acetyltransferase [Rhodoglobus sp.]